MGRGLSKSKGQRMQQADTEMGELGRAGTIKEQQLTRYRETEDTGCPRSERFVRRDTGKALCQVSEIDPGLATTGKQETGEAGLRERKPGARRPTGPWRMDELGLGGISDLPRGSAHSTLDPSVASRDSSLEVLCLCKQKRCTASLTQF